MRVSPPHHRRRPALRGDDDEDRQQQEAGRDRPRHPGRFHGLIDGEEADAERDAGEAGPHPAGERALAGQDRPVLGKLGARGSGLVRSRFWIIGHATGNACVSAMVPGDRKNRHRRLQRRSQGSLVDPDGRRTNDPEPVSSNEGELLRFAASSFPSVWALELLLVLKSEARKWTQPELIASLRASDLVVTRR